MVVARDEPHAPEISIAVDGENALFVESDSVDELAAALVRMAMEREAWIARRQKIAADSVNEYSVEAMASGFLAAIELARTRRRGCSHRGFRKTD